MRLMGVFASLVIIGLLSACSSAEDDAARAQEEVAQERLKLVEDYRECVDDAHGDAEEIEACDSYLKAAEALK